MSVELTDAKVEDIVRNFVLAIVDQDVEKGLSYLAADAQLFAPEGAFEGKEDVGQYLNWLIDRESKVEVVDDEEGVGVITEGERASYECLIRGLFKGVEDIAANFVFQLREDGKIKRIRVIYDRVGVIDDMAHGWLGRRVIGSIIRELEEGLAG